MDVLHVADVSNTIAVGFEFWLPCVIFIVALLVIIFEKVDKTAVALFGACSILLCKVVEQHESFHIEEFGVDWNVIFLLIGMMAIINIMRPTGVFEYIAVKGAKLGKGRPLSIMLIFAAITAVSSALLDNVTTVLLLAPVTLLIADALKVNPIPFLLIEALASNIGGTATLIGDPPNIMIASKAKLNFVDFLIHLAPIVLVMMVVFLLIVWVVFRKDLKTTDDLRERIMRMDEKDAIKDKSMLIISLIVLGAVLFGFVTHGIFHYQPATIALAGASLLFVISSLRPKSPKSDGKDVIERALETIEWKTIFFFVGLFIMVGGLVKVGAIKLMSQEMLAITEGNLFATSMVIMWFSAVASAVVDNIPYVATMNPLIVDMAKELWPHATDTELLQHTELMPIWWSLALGSCLGGNGSPIGASANVIVVGMAEKAGHKISFLKFMAYGVPITILTVAISAVYVWLRYYHFA